MKPAIFLLAFFFNSVTGSSQVAGHNKILDKVALDFNIQNTDNFLQRINAVNTDIKMNGIKENIPDSNFLLTGYSYGEFYDWDLYFENIYMSYFGVSDYCFSNLKAFIDVLKY